MLIIMMQAVSALFQFLASFFAFRLMKTTGRKYIWLLISISLFLIGIRRILAVCLVFTAVNFKPYFVNEMIGMFSSFLIFFGVKWFHSMLASQERLKEALRQSEQKFREIVINLDEGFYSATLDGILLEHNRAFNRILGFDITKDLKGEYLPDFWENPEEGKVYLNKLTAAGYVSRHQINARTISGKAITVLVSAHLVKDKDNRPLRIEGVFLDITDRIHGEERIRRLNRTLAMLSDINQAIVRVRDPQILFEKACNIAVDKGNFLLAWIGLLDNSTHKLLPVAFAGNSEDYFEQIDISLDDEPRAYCSVDRALRSGEYALCNDMKLNIHPAPCREAIIKNGIDSCISLPLKVSGDIRGAINFYAGKRQFFDEEEIRYLEELAMDISFALEFSEKEEDLEEYRVNLEKLVKARTDELAKSRNLLRTLIDSLPDEIYAKDREYRFIMANCQVLRTFGLSDFRDILGKTDFELLPREEALKACVKEQSLIQHNGQITNYEDQVTDREGKSHWLAVTKVPVRDREGNVTGLVGINRDITYFKETEEALRRAKEEAEAANIAKSTFLSSMSHEIRTPLNAILGFSQLMQNDDKMLKKHVKWLEIINSSGEHLLALINDVLEICRIEADHITSNPSTFNILFLLGDIEAMFRVRTDQKNLSLRFDLSDDLPEYVVADEGKLRQIIINLVGNAVKFTREGGIVIKASAALPGTDKNNLRLTMEVEDTGPGIAEEDISKLFQKFGQTEAGIREGGTGLGLTISRQYARIMGGDIAVRSEEGKGACFILTIDIEQGADLVKKENRKRKVTRLKPGQKQYRILAADDRANNLELLKIMLTSVGFEVEEARNGNEAMEKFRACSPDLILMDMRMPVMDGYEAIRRIREMDKGRIPIIAVTASAFQEDKQKAREAGADGYLRKPFNEHELFECIESCLGVQYDYN